MPRKTLLVPILALLVLLSSCELFDLVGGPKVTLVQIDQVNQVLAVGDTVTLTATVTASGNAATTVTWGSSAGAVATVGPMTGLVTALEEGTTVITATSTSDATKTSSITVTVEAVEEAELGEDDVVEAVNDLAVTIEAMSPHFEAELAMAALLNFDGYIPGFTGVVALDDASFGVRFVRSVAPGLLPRGIYVWDPTELDWLFEGASADLVHRWPFKVGEAEHEAALVIDWGTTVFVDDTWGDTYEVPTEEMSVTMTIDDAVVASFVTAFAWYEAPACPDGVLEPTRVFVDGTFGVDATLSLHQITLELTPAAGGQESVGLSGEIVAEAAGNRMGFAWDVSVTGDLTRIDCFIDTFVPSYGTVDLLAYSEAPSGASSIGLTFGIDNVVLGDHDEPVSIDIEGSLVIDGATAVSFSGTLDDEDGDGIPGDNLVLVFSNGDTMTLAEFLTARFEAVASTAMRLLSQLR